MSDIFISHAKADHKLAEALVYFLKEAIGVPEASIFCSSVKGHGIPFSANFSDYMIEKIKDPKVVILLITETYLERHFCLMELGAAWAKSLKACPIVVGDVPLQTVTNTIGLTQAWKISDHSGLNDLRTMIEQSGITLEKRGSHAWDDKRNDWRAKLKKIVSELPKRSFASREELDDAHKIIANKNKNIADLEGQLERLEDRFEKLKLLKDKDEVEEFDRNVIYPSKLDEFNALIENLSNAKPERIWRGVYKHIILDHLGIPGKIDWQNDEKEFTVAFQSKLIDEDGAVLWDTKKLKEIDSAIKSVKKFLKDPENDGFISFMEQKEIPMDVEDIDFIEFHLKI